MSDEKELEARLRGYLARGAARPAPSELEARLLKQIPAAPGRWLPQLLAAAAVVLLVVGVGFAFQNLRAQRTVRPAGGGVVSPGITPTPSATVGSTPAVGPTASSGAGGTLGLSSIHMVSANVGWATGDTDNHVNGPNAGVFRTVDGGIHWQTVTPRDQQWVDIVASSTQPQASYQTTAHFLDGERAWVAGIITTTTDSTVTVFSTSDGGAHWQAGASFRAIQSAGAYLDFVDNSHGWLLLEVHQAMQIDRVAIYATADGSHWRLLTDNTACNIDGLTFNSDSAGWTSSACAETGPSVATTHDGGRTWHAQPLPFPPPSVESCGCDSFAPIFLSASIGVIPTNGPIMFMTSDAGRNWSLRRLPARAAFQDFEMPLTAGRVDPETGTVYSTSDGAHSWNPVSTIPNVTNVPQLDFVDQSTGFALRGPGKSPLLKTIDGGHTWHEIQPTYS